MQRIAGYFLCNGLWRMLAPQLRQRMIQAPLNCERGAVGICFGTIPIEGRKSWSPPLLGIEVRCEFLSKTMSSPGQPHAQTSIRLPPASRPTILLPQHQEAGKGSWKSVPQEQTQTLPEIGDNKGFSGMTSIYPQPKKPRAYKAHWELFASPSKEGFPQDK